MKSIKSRYVHLPELRRIDRHRSVPKAISTATKTKRVMIDSQKRKEENLKKHSKEGKVLKLTERSNHLVASEE